MAPFASISGPRLCADSVRITVTGLAAELEEGRGPCRAGWGRGGGCGFCWRAACRLSASPSNNPPPQGSVARGTPWVCPTWKGGRVANERGRPRGKQGCKSQTRAERGGGGGGRGRPRGRQTRSALTGAQLLEVIGRPRLSPRCLLSYSRGDVQCRSPQRRQRGAAFINPALHGGTALPLGASPRWLQVFCARSGSI